MTSASDDRETRAVVRRLLELLSNREAQREYESDVPIANVPAELICMWFDDHYHPEAEWFAEAFSEVESVHLAAFHDVFAGVADSLPVSTGVAALHGTPVCDTVCSKAAETVALLDSRG